MVKQLVNSSILQAMILCSQKQYLGFGFLIHLVILFHYFICCFTDTHLCVCVCVCVHACVSIVTESVCMDVWVRRKVGKLANHAIDKKFSAVLLMSI